MVYSLTYRRPSYVDASSRGLLSEDEKQKIITESVKSNSSCSNCAGIPEALSFDRIISGGTCPPCTLRDFMNYLKYIEMDAENLQFFLWLKAYEEKFKTLPDAEKNLSSEWTLQKDHAAMTSRNSTRNSSDTARGPHANGIEEKASKRLEGASLSNPFGTRSCSPSNETQRQAAPSEYSSNEGTLSSGFVTNSSASLIRQKASDAYVGAGLKWQPFTIQPFRDEIARVVAIYIAEGSPRQLNMSSKERSSVLYALEHTTHPSVFRKMRILIEWTLRAQSHPNFIRWSICNGNAPRVAFARGVGILGIMAGLLLGLLTTLSRAGRGWRIMAFILFFLGIATLIAAWKGMCVVLHGMHHRHLRPWELFQEHDDIMEDLKDKSMDSLKSYHSYEDEPWVGKYDKRSAIRKVFDREIWVQEPALRQIQDTIFVQAVLGGILGGAILTAIFVAVPRGNFY